MHTNTKFPKIKEGCRDLGDLAKWFSQLYIYYLVYIIDPIFRGSLAYSPFIFFAVFVMDSPFPHLEIYVNRKTYLHAKRKPLIRTVVEGFGLAHIRGPFWPSTQVTRPWIMSTLARILHPIIHAIVNYAFDCGSISNPKPNLMNSN